MYNFDDEYWDFEGVVDAKYNNWIQKTGNNKYVRPTEPSDTQSGRRSSMVIILGDQEHPVITGEGVYYAKKERADIDDYPFDYGWVYSCQIQIYNDVYRTDANNIVAVAGGTYGEKDCTIPTFEEWSAMTESEKDAFKGTYFEYPTPTSTSLIGVSIGYYYDVYGWIGCIGRGSGYPTDENFPYYVAWRDITSTLTEGRFDLNYDLMTETPTYKNFDIILSEPFKEVSSDSIKAIVIVTQKQYHMKYWTGYNSSGAMTYTTNTKGRSSDGATGLTYRLKLCDWKMKADKNHGYPYNRDVEAFDFDLIVKPIPFFYWTVSRAHNNGYASLGVGWQPVYIGAFTYATNVTNVSIPRSVNFIGEYAFRNTQIAEVTIDRTCTRSDTSFPKDCDVNFYNN